MSSAILIEGLSSALSVTRQTASQFVATIEKQIENFGKSDLSRKISDALSTNSDSFAGAYAVAQIGADVAFGNKDILKVILGIAGVVWGAAIVNAALLATGSVVLVAGVVSLPVVLAFLFGLILMFVCGRFTLNVVRQMFAKLNEFGTDF